MISPTLHSQAIVNKRREENLPVYNYGLGENPLNPPDQFIKCIGKYLDKKQYTSASGLPELNSAIKTLYSNSNYEIDNVLFGNGLKELIFIIQASFEGIIFHITPSWVSYKEQVFILNKRLKTIFIETHIRDKYLINLEHLDKTLSKYAHQKKLIIFNNPGNPTGICYGSQSIKNISEIIKKHNCIILADEIYQNITYNDDFTSISEYVPDLTIRGSSISKDLSCGGYRLGWVTFPKSLLGLYRKGLCYGSSIYSCPTTCIQYGLADYLMNHSEDYSQYCSRSRDIFNEISSIIFKELRKTDIEFTSNNSSWYIFLDFNNYGDKLNKMKIYTGIQLCEYLLNTFGIVMVAGEHFSQKGLFARMSMIDIDDINNIDMNNIKNSCKGIIEGLDILTKFLN